MERLRTSFQGGPAVLADGLDLVGEKEESKNILIPFYDKVQTPRTPFYIIFYRNI